MESAIKITLPNGMTIEGTAEQLKEILPKLGFDSILGTREYYFSASSGAVRIADMETRHLMNAIKKYYREWAASLSAIKDPRKLVATIQDGITDPCWCSMAVECSKRVAPTE